jgi:hypothetical protein
MYSWEYTAEKITRLKELYSSVSGNEHHLELKTDAVVSYLQHFHQQRLL